ncbi:MAG TPA: nuclease-related domain-containing protein [Anaerolineae bacterium]|nr:nuclease-related domain-containing protein [Anaerolineae bacterium]HMR65683.1 nuclease-related domain-containing protein [Anaerolineae bacterium]
MKVTTNQELVESRAKWGRRIAPVTLLLLVAGLITNFMSINQPEYFQITLILLFGGFISAIFSSNLVNNWVREPRSDQTLVQLLKKFGNDYELFNYTSPVPHALLAPDGIHAITVKKHDGEITINGRRIHRKFTWRRLFRLFSDEGLGTPIGEAEGNAAKLTKYLRRSLPEEQIPPVKPLLLFSNPEARLSVHDPAIPVMATKEFKTYLREQGKMRNVSSDRRKQLAELLVTPK